MNLQSVKTRFMGSYLALLILFIIQIPIIYFVVTGLSEKYMQVEEAGALRKRAVEITGILNRHIMTGNEELEKVFQTKKKEYNDSIETLRKGSKDVTAIKDKELLAKLNMVESRWNDMRSELDRAMDDGDNLQKRKAVVEDSTAPMVLKIEEMIAAFEDLRDPAFVQYINKSGKERARTNRMSFDFERYFNSSVTRQEIGKGIRQLISDFDDGLAELKKASSLAASKGAKGEKVAASVKTVENIWAERKQDIIEGMAGVDHFAGRMDTLIEKHTPSVVEAANDLTRSVVAKSGSSAMRALTVMVVSVIISALIAVGFMWATKNQIIIPLMRIKETVDDFAKGDLTHRAGVQVRFFGRQIHDEITGLGASVDEMASQMSRVIGRITDSSALLASASEQLSASSSQIDDGANRQSTQTTQVATSMEEMNATVVEVAKNTQQVAEAAKDAKGIAVQGGGVVKQAIAAMQEVAESTSVTADTVRSLGKSSEEIGTIVSVINDIADQTNLLALNAAIEAARAGEQGRGFAVVADEVRKLAERTTKATKEISTMICAIQDETGKAVTAMAEGTAKVENGVKLANEAGESLGRIVVGVQGVSDMISHIATSTEEQSATTDEISRNMDSINEVSKTNVQAIGEVSKATVEMARLATELKEMVSNFRIDRTEAAAERKSPASSRAAQNLRIVRERDLPSLAVENV